MVQRVIVTSRLRLRPPESSDAASVFQGYAQDPEVARYLIWRPHRSLAETKQFIRASIDAWSTGSEWPWVITRLSDDALIGMLAARPDGGHRASVGYVLARAEWGKGYVPEALSAVIAALWDNPQVYRIWAVCDVENPASARVMEKAGMRCEGRLARYVVHPNVSDEPRDAYLYAVTR